MLGISVYAGLDLSLEENINYLKEAKELGVEDVFLSLHIPEVNSNFLEEIKKLVSVINSLDFNLTADISKKYYERLDLTKFNFDVLRLDFGFNNQEIAKFSQNKSFKVNLNASTITEADLKEIISHGGNPENFEASHNFYPRRETGLSEKLLKKKNNLLKKYDIKIGAFVPAQYKKRPPMNNGLPTLEKHRFLNPLVAAQDLFKLGIDKVYIGDSRASRKELKDFTEISKDMMVIPINIIGEPGTEEKRLLNLEHRNRQDPGEFMVRSETARKNKKERISARNTAKRFKYSVTIDNHLYQRYEGDLQILKKEYSADKKINVVADAGKAAVIIEKIKEGEKFKFKIKGES